MRTSKFIRELLLTITLSIAGIAIINYVLGDNEDWLFSWVALMFFALITVIMYFFGQRAMTSDNKYKFIHLLMINVMFKIVGCVGIASVYYKLYQPQSRFFILPFLIVYLIFMVFETYVLITQSNKAKS